jgi:hypothetical protein
MGEMENTSVGNSDLQYFPSFLQHRWKQHMVYMVSFILFKTALLTSWKGCPASCEVL